MPSFVTCGPNEAIIVSGCCQSNPTIRAGGRVFVWPIFHKVQRISLNTMTISVESPKVYSSEGVPVTVKGVAQVKIQGQDLVSLRSASEMFLDKSEEEIMDIAKATIDGHQRSIIAMSKIDDIYKKRKEFSQSVQTAAQTDLIDMGLTLVSFTVQNISDDDGYLDALGQVQTITVKSQARQAIANSKAATEQESLDAEHKRKIKDIDLEQDISLKRLEFEKLQATYMKNHCENQAKSEKSGELKQVEIQQNIVEEELGVVLLEKRKETELIMKRKELRDIKLKVEIERKADYECQREIDLSKAMEAKIKIEAQAEAEKIKGLAEARADIILQQKQAEADVLRKRAEAFKQFGNAAKLEMVLATLPRLTAEIAGPISDCNKITSVSQDGEVGFSRITGEIMQVVEQICDSVGNLTGQSIAGISVNHSGGGGSPPSITASARRPSTESLSGQPSTSKTSSYGRWK